MIPSLHPVSSSPISRGRRRRPRQLPPAILDGDNPHFCITRSCSAQAPHLHDGAKEDEVDSVRLCGFGWRLDLVCVAALAAHWQGSPEAEPTGGAARPESYGRWASTKCRLASRHIQPHGGA